MIVKWACRTLLELIFVVEEFHIKKAFGFLTKVWTP